MPIPTTNADPIALFLPRRPKMGLDQDPQERVQQAGSGVLGFEPMRTQSIEQTRCVVRGTSLDVLFDVVDAFDENHVVRRDRIVKNHAAQIRRLFQRRQQRSYFKRVVTLTPI